MSPLNRDRLPEGEKLAACGRVSVCIPNKVLNILLLLQTATGCQFLSLGSLFGRVAACLGRCAPSRCWRVSRCP